MIDPAQAAGAMFKQVKWDEQFLHAFSMGQLGFFIIALLIGVAALAAAATSLAIIAAWFRVQQAPAVLGLVLLPLSAVAVLSLPSIGLFILPTVTIGWVVFGLRHGAGQRTTT